MNALGGGRGRQPRWTNPNAVNMQSDTLSGQIKWAFVRWYVQKQTMRVRQDRTIVSAGAYLPWCWLRQRLLF